MILDFGKYSLEILFSYLSTFSLILILVISTYLNSKKVKKDLDKFTNIIRDFNKHIQKDNRVSKNIIPIGDGLTICIKK